MYTLLLLFYPEAVIVVATDGQSSDGDVLKAMKPLERLPVWVVIRLCTNDEKIVRYWSDIDSNLELDIDVLDDLQSEATEVRSANKWLRYGVPMQRLREFGISTKEFDLLDERSLTSEQMRLCVSSILGGSLEDYPHPEVDWPAFQTFVERKLRSEGMVWSPIKMCPVDW